MRKQVHDAILKAAEKEGVTLNTVADEVIALVPDATHAEVAQALNLRVKDLFDHEPFPDGVHMGHLTKADSKGNRRAPVDCVV